VLCSLLFSTSRTMCFLKYLHHIPHCTLLLRFLTCVYVTVACITCAITAVWLSSHGSVLYHHTLRYEFGVDVYIFIHMCCISFIFYYIHFLENVQNCRLQKVLLIVGYQSAVNDHTFSLCTFSPVNSAAKVCDRFL